MAVHSELFDWQLSYVEYLDVYDRCYVSHRAFWGFAEHFRAQAESVLSSLDQMKQKQLLGEQPSDSSSNTSLNSLGQGSRMLMAASKTTRPLSKGPRSGYRAVESSGIDLPSYFTLSSFYCIFGYYYDILVYLVDSDDWSRRLCR